MTQPLLRNSSPLPKKQKYSHPDVPDREITSTKKPTGLRPGWQSTIKMVDSVLTASTLKPPQARKNYKGSSSQLATSAKAVDPCSEYGGFASDYASDASANKTGKEAPKVTTRNNYKVTGKVASQGKQHNGRQSVQQVCHYVELIISRWFSVALLIEFYYH